jgi:alginate O-acetyltransferase complex protein AlgI
VSRMLNITLPVNFESPYKAISITDFWRRWHMTLSRFLRDYLYIPLGGNRRGPVRRYANLLATMALGGLWHGAGWNFLIWGFLHGLYLCVNHAWDALAVRRWPSLRLPRAISWALTFTSVMVAWIFFRAPDTATALRILAAMVGIGGSPDTLHEAAVSSANL